MNDTSSNGERRKKYKKIIGASIDGHSLARICNRFSIVKLIIRPRWVTADIMYYDGMFRRISDAKSSVSFKYGEINEICIRINQILDANILIISSVSRGFLLAETEEGIINCYDTSFDQAGILDEINYDSL
jgi:hypothetical protein